MLTLVAIIVGAIGVVFNFLGTGASIGGGYVDTLIQMFAGLGGGLATLVGGSVDTVLDLVLQVIAGLANLIPNWG